MDFKRFILWIFMIALGTGSGIVYATVHMPSESRFRAGIAMPPAAGWQAAATRAAPSALHAAAASVENQKKSESEPTDKQQTKTDTVKSKEASKKKNQPLKKFVPSEKIAPDHAVDFPTDI